MIQAVVFDFDGTLVTTEEAEFASWSQLYQEHGAELVLDEWVKCVGQPAGTWSAFDHLCDLTGTSHDSEAVHERRLALLEAELESLALMPGVGETIELLAEQQIPMGIASNSTYGWVETNLDRVGHLKTFRAIMTRDRAARPKPAPDSYLEVCRLLGAEPARSLAFEDSPAGLAAAKAAGLYTIAIPGPITQHLDFSPADAQAKSFTDYLPHLREQLGV